MCCEQWRNVSKKDLFGSLFGINQILHWLWWMPCYSWQLKRKFKQAHTWNTKFVKVVWHTFLMIQYVFITVSVSRQSKIQEKIKHWPIKFSAIILATSELNLIKTVISCVYCPLQSLNEIQTFKCKLIQIKGCISFLYFIHYWCTAVSFLFPSPITFCKIIPKEKEKYNSKLD